MQYPNDERYYGKKNWETWNTYNILSSYEDAYDRIMCMVREAKDIQYFREMLKQDIEDNLLEHLEYSFGDDTPLGQLFDTAVTTYLESVDWQEIAEAFWEDIEQDEDEEVGE